MNKKGQAEIIGLVVVVLLLIFALVFFLKIKLSEDDQETMLIRSNLRANSALNALMKVNVDDENQMKDLIESCFENQMGACDDTKNNFTNYLPLLFDEKEYFLSVVRNNGNVFESLEFGTNCVRGVSASPFIIRDRGKVKFRICSY